MADSNTWHGWALVLAYVLCIYLSLPFMRPLLARLHALLGPAALSLAVNGVLGLCAALLLLAGLRRGPGTAAALLLLLAAVGWAASRIEVPEERFHFLEYGLLGLLVHRAGSRGVPFLLLLLLTILAGAVDEAIQYLLPDRVGELRDVALNSGGGLAGLCAGHLLRRPRQSISPGPGGRRPPGPWWRRRGHRR